MTTGSDTPTTDQTSRICAIIIQESESRPDTRREERLPMPGYEEMVF